VHKRQLTSRICYTQIQCPHDNITTGCFQGTLNILRGIEH